VSARNFSEDFSSLGNHMTEEIPIREYEQAVYVYWFGPDLPTVKIGHSHDPDKRLAQLGNDTGVPDHLASFAAIVWLDRKREKVEALAHELANDFHRTGEWFELTASAALEYILEASRQLGVRFEVEDRAGIYRSPPKTFHEAKKIYEESQIRVREEKTKLLNAEDDLNDSELDYDSAKRILLTDRVKYCKDALKAAQFQLELASKAYSEKLSEYRKTPEYAEEQRRLQEQYRREEETRRINELRFNENSIKYWNNKWAENKKPE
jgi:T5orf172 domain